MPSIAAVSKIDLPFRINQKSVKEHVRNTFIANFNELERLLESFDNSGIEFRNLCKSLEYYSNPTTFEESNNEYTRCALQNSIAAVNECLSLAKVTGDDITDVLFVSSTGLATPTLDALIINKLRLNPHANRTPIWGLGCGGGVSGIAKASVIAKANPDAVVLLITVELCSLTFLRDDYSKSNFIASSLFSDGIAACIVKGDNHPAVRPVSIIASRSKLYYDTVDVMGWDFLDAGFRVVFSKDIPDFIHKNIKNDVIEFLSNYQLELSDIKNFVFHPGGKKVLGAYSDALEVKGDFLKTTREVMKDNGNMSSATILYVLEKFLYNGYVSGHGLMLAMGPGFSSEMVLLSMNE